MAKARSRKKWILIIIIAIALLSYCTHEKEITYILANDKTTKIPIPPEIVKSKNCEEYHKWFDANFTPLVVASNRCPWTKPPKGPIGEFEINGEKFWIPRNYLWPDKLRPDGREKALNLLMVYPSMEPPSKVNNDSNFTILVHLHTTAYWKDCQEKGLCDYSLSSYEYYSHKDKLTKEQKKQFPKNLGYDPKLDLTNYEYKTIRLFYVRGDINKPKYWLLCDGGTRKENYNPGCEVFTNLTNKIYVEYLFRQTDLLPFHDEVRNKVMAKLKEFQLNPEVPK